MNFPVLNKKVPLLSFYREAFHEFGHRGWWPGKTVFEIIIGAILTQNSAWKNVEKAIHNLRSRKILHPRRLEEISLEELATCIRPSGYFNQKARKIKEFLVWCKSYNYNFQKIRKIPLERLRQELLSVWGIGPETADSILLYAFQKEIFVIDAYTFRIGVRHHWWGLDENVKYSNVLYQQLQKLFMKNIEEEMPEREERVKLYNDLHAQIVYIGHHFCKRKSLCDLCPWQKFFLQPGNHSSRLQERF